MGFLHVSRSESFSRVKTKYYRKEICERIEDKGRQPVPFSFKVRLFRNISRASLLYGLEDDEVRGHEELVLGRLQSLAHPGVRRSLGSLNTVEWIQVTAGFRGLD
jgi:hypothetical protein